MLAVVFFHLAPQSVPGGYVGVDIFFVISGFVISNSLLHSKDQPLLTLLGQFYVRRIRRLFPALFLMIITVSVVIMLIYRLDVANFTLKTAVAANIGVSNLFLHVNQADYWAPSSALNPFLHTWSLGVEEQFYFAFPLVVLFLKSVLQKIDMTWALPSAIGILGGLSLLIFLSSSHSFSEVGFYLPHTRVWEFVIGIALALWHSKAVDGDELGRRNRQIVGVSRWGVVVIEVMSIFTLLLCLSPFSKHWGYATNVILANVATAIIISSFIGKGRIVPVYMWPPLRYTGRISYSVYLWHWPVITIFDALALDAQGVGHLVLKVFVTISLAMASYHLVEQRYRYQRFFTDVRRELCSLFVIVGISTCAIIGVYYALKPFAKNQQTFAKMVHNDLLCHDPKGVRDTITACLAANNSLSNTVYVVGDSHAGNLIPSVRLAVAGQFNVRYLTGHELLDSLKGIPACSGVDCSGDERQRINDFFVKRIRAGDKVLIAVSRDTFLKGEYNSQVTRETDEERLKNFSSNLTILIQSVIGKGGHFYILDSLPKLCSHARYERGKFFTPNNPCSNSREASLEDRRLISVAYKKLALVTGATVLDPHDVLCPMSICTSRFRDQVYAFDGSPHFMTSLPAPLDEFFSSNLSLSKNQ